MHVTLIVQPLKFTIFKIFIFKFWTNFEQILNDHVGLVLQKLRFAVHHH